MDDPSRQSAASILLMSYVDDQVTAIRHHGSRMREDEADAVHKMRIAIRRLRAALATYRKLLDPDVVSHLRGELKWLAAASGAARQPPFGVNPSVQLSKPYGSWGPPMAYSHRP